MTAEVAILNPSAVALAADSAMTFGPPGDEKIYNVNKLFTLSKYHPVGIMIYNSADFMRVPFETVVKMHRTNIGDQPKATVFEYANDFINHLVDSRFRVPEQVENNVEGIFYSTFNGVNKSAFEALQEEFNKTGKIPKQKISQIIRAEIDSEIARLESRNDCPSLGNISNPRTIVSRYEAQFQNAVSFAFSRVKITKSNISALRRLARLALLKDSLSDGYTGIVIAGFGQHEMFPSLRAIEIDGVIDDQLKYVLKEDLDIGRDAFKAGIRAFAQREMVDRFMCGIDPDLETYVEILVEGLMEELGEEIVDAHVPGTAAYRTSIKNGLSSIIEQYIDRFMTKFVDTQKKAFIDPVTSAVGNMPKPELAHMAEALVNLTSVKRRVSVEKETVGGPVDVAVISKGDGFVWIKRKHYFSAELNQDFIHKYFM